MLDAHFVCVCLMSFNCFTPITVAGSIMSPMLQFNRNVLVSNCKESTSSHPSTSLSFLDRVHADNLNRFMNGLIEAYRGCHGQLSVRQVNGVPFAL